MKSILVTRRDVEILKFIRGRGKVTCKVIQKQFGMSESMAYRRLRLLVGANYLQKIRTFQDMPGDYLLTTLGVHLLKGYEEQKAAQETNKEIPIEDIPGIRQNDILFLHDMGVTHLPAGTTKSKAVKIAKKIYAERKAKE